MLYFVLRPVRNEPEDFISMKGAGTVKIKIFCKISTDSGALRSILVLITHEFKEFPNLWIDLIFNSSAVRITNLNFCYGDNNHDPVSTKYFLPKYKLNVYRVSCDQVTCKQLTKMCCY